MSVVKLEKKENINTGSSTDILNNVYSKNEIVNETSDEECLSCQ